MGKLIILRGNSGSGKTTVAKELQKKFGYNTMPISQDEIRRNILWVKDGIDTKALPLMIELLKYGYEHSDIVILEGIMHEEWYNPLFKVANELYGSNVYSYYFDIPFEETIRRHQTRSKSQEFGEEHMRGWWREKDFSAVLKEQLITCEMDANSIVAMEPSMESEKFILTDKPHSTVRKEGFPLDSISLDIKTNKYYYDLPEDKLEQVAVGDGFLEFFKNILNLN